MLVKTPTPGKLYFLKKSKVWYFELNSKIENQEACLVISVIETKDRYEVIAMLPSKGVVTRSSYIKFHNWSDWWSEEP